MQVFDGSSWIALGTSYPTVELNGEVQVLLQWAREQRDKQMVREQRIQNNPALKKAYEAIERAEANYEILDKIVGEDGNHIQA
jgi:hypothetical protein